MTKEKATTKIYTDVVIAGSGVAGLYTSLCLDNNIDCIIINKSGIKKSNSMYAQGGIAAVMDIPGENDSTDLHFQDTMEAGCNICSSEAVKVMVEGAKDCIEDLISLGVEFDKGKDEFLLTKEGGHSRKRILHCGGDATGLQITRALYSRITKRDNITLMNNFFLADILVSGNNAYGVRILDGKDRSVIVFARKIIIATGGIGRIFRNSTNASGITGDGIAAAIRAGALVSDMEFIQFHPTAMAHPSETGRYFLISEAVRGEGGILRNRKWKSFMQHAHPSGDLAPRDIVSRAIIQEMKKEDIPNVYLDITHKPRHFLMGRFPTIYKECMNRGVDIAKTWIPVIPVQHYIMGGIKTDIDGMTSIYNLYAVGEAACTGVHGANRLASNSLLECIVFSKRISENINAVIRKEKLPLIHGETLESFSGRKSQEKDMMDHDSIASEVRLIMTSKCGIIRNKTDLIESLDRITEMKFKAEKCRISTKKDIETHNMLILAQEILNAALKREKSIGAHYREY